MATRTKNKAAVTTIRRPGRLRDERGGKFRLEVGIHIGDGPKGCDCDNCTLEDGKNHVYEEGDIINSAQDLARRHNAGPGSTKFTRVSDDYDPNENSTKKSVVSEMEENQVPIDKMTMPQLREYGRRLGVDLSGVTRKEDVLNAIRAKVETTAAAAESRDPEEDEEEDDEE